MQTLQDADPWCAALAALVDQTPWAVALVDPRLRVLASSPHWMDRKEAVFPSASAAYTASSTSALPARDPSPTDLPEPWIKVIRRGLAGETLDYDRRDACWTNGQSPGPGWHVRPLRDSSGTIFAVAVFIDSMSPPPQAKEDIDRLNDRLRQVTSAMSVAIFEYEFKTGTSIISDEHLASLNLTRDHLPATPEDWFDLLRPLDPDAYWQHWKRAMSPEGEGRFSFEVRPLVNGQERQMELQAHVRFSGQGPARQPERMFGMLVDHTENRRMQAALSRAQRQETVGRMAGMVAHDFNNILTVILANIELAELRTADPELHQLLRNATNAAEMGASFNKRLLALAGGHRAQVAALPVAVDEHIARTWAVFQRVLSDELSLVFHPGAPNAVVAIDPAEIDGAILNLVMNARDAQMQGGTIMLETSCALSPSALARRPKPADRPFIRITVRDQGVGMPKEVLDRVVEPFFTTKSGGHGNGLGLTSVVLSAERAGGFVDIQSTLGVGTEVSVCLPVIDLPAAAVRTRSEDYPFGNGELVLVVEDDPHVREAVMQRLEAIGYAVLEAANGEAGWKLIESGEPFDLVLSDVVMPGALSGYDLIRKVKAKYPGIATLLTSGHVSAALRDLDAADPKVRLLSKPYSLRDMAEAVAQALRQVREAM